MNVSRELYPEHPFPGRITGPSGCGKTHLLNNFITSLNIETDFKKFLIAYL